MRWSRNTSQAGGLRYELGTEVAHPRVAVSIPRTAHLAVIGASNSGKGSVIANIVAQEAHAGGEVWFIDLKSGMEAENYAAVLARKAYSMDEAEKPLRDFNTEVDIRAKQWRGRLRSLDDRQVKHRLLVVDEAADMIRSGNGRRQSDACVELMRSVLSRSRALNCTILVATQNPRVSSSLPYRSLLLTTLALRLNSKAEATMALGEDAVRRGARPWQIRFDRPGDGYLWDSEANSVRYLHVPFVTDEEIHMLRKEDGEAEAGRSGSGSPASDWDSDAMGQPQGATTTPPQGMRDEGQHDSSTKNNQ